MVVNEIINRSLKQKPSPLNISVEAWKDEEFVRNTGLWIMSDILQEKRALSLSLFIAEELRRTRGTGCCLMTLVRRRSPDTKGTALTGL